MAAEPCQLAQLVFVGLDMLRHQRDDVTIDESEEWGRDEEAVLRALDHGLPMVEVHN